MDTDAPSATETADGTTPSDSTTSSGVSTLAAGLAVLVGLAVVAYALLLVSVSPLGAAHVGAIGLSLALSGAFATEWVRARFDLSETTQRRLSIGFAALALVLLVLFAVINGATFSEGSETSG